jgi:hypothetical protein
MNNYIGGLLVQTGKNISYLLTKLYFVECVLIPNFVNKKLQIVSEKLALVKRYEIILQKIMIMMNNNMSQDPVENARIQNEKNSLLCQKSDLLINSEFLMLEIATKFPKEQIQLIFHNIIATFNHHIPKQSSQFSLFVGDLISIGLVQHWKAMYVTPGNTGPV